MGEHPFKAEAEAAWFLDAKVEGAPLYGAPTGLTDPTVPSTFYPIRHHSSVVKGLGSGAKLWGQTPGPLPPGKASLPL